MNDVQMLPAKPFSSGPGHIPAAQYDNKTKRTRPVFRPFIANTAHKRVARLDHAAQRKDFVKTYTVRPSAPVALFSRKGYKLQHKKAQDDLASLQSLQKANGPKQFTTLDQDLIDFANSDVVGEHLKKKSGSHSSMHHRYVDRQLESKFHRYNKDREDEKKAWKLYTDPAYQARVRAGQFASLSKKDRVAIAKREQAAFRKRHADRQMDWEESQRQGWGHAARNENAVLNMYQRRSAWPRSKSWIAGRFRAAVAGVTSKRKAFFKELRKPGVIRSLAQLYRRYEVNQEDPFRDPASYRIYLRHRHQYNPSVLDAVLTTFNKENFKKEHKFDLPRPRRCFKHAGLQFKPRSCQRCH